MLSSLTWKLESHCCFGNETYRKGKEPSEYYCACSICVWVVLYQSQMLSQPQNGASIHIFGVPLSTYNITDAIQFVSIGLFKVNTVPNKYTHQGPNTQHSRQIVSYIFKTRAPAAPYSNMFRAQQNPTHIVYGASTNFDILSLPKYI